jgi:hypothetical protein
MSEMPKHDKSRPDFMITGPDVHIADGVRLEDVLEEESSRANVLEEEDEAPGHRYYESTKILGSLYHAIKERVIFQELQQDSNSAIGARVDDRAIINKVWEYVLRETALIQWKDQVSEARRIRET